MTREDRHPNIRNSELWTVLAEVRGEGVGLQRGTKIQVTVEGEGENKRLLLSPLSLSDWGKDPSLTEVEPHTDADDPGRWDPEWHWQGNVVRDGRDHTIKLGVVPGDPGILALHVNQNGIAVILR